MAEPTHQHEERATSRSSTTAIFDRIYKVESDMGQIREQIAGITVSMNTQAQVLSRIAVSLEQKGVTDWKALSSWAAVIIAVIGLAATLILQPMRSTIDGNKAVLDRLVDSRIDEARRAEQVAEMRGRYMERVDRNGTELLEQRRRISELERK